MHIHVRTYMLSQKNNTKAKTRVSKKEEIKKVWEDHWRGWNSRWAKENRHNFQKQSWEVRIKARVLRRAKAHLENNKYQGLNKTVYLEKYRKEN